jgi:hypothetical protein
MTWNTALIFKYGLPVPGREAKAMEVFADGTALWGKYAADGMCAEPEFFHHLFGGGMMIVRAESFDKLFVLLEKEESKKLIDACTFAAQDFELTFMQTGDLLMEDMGLYSTVGAELGYM